MAGKGVIGEPSNEWTGRIRVTHKAVFAGKGPRHGAKEAPAHAGARTRQHVGVELSFFWNQGVGVGVWLSGLSGLGTALWERAKQRSRVAQEPDTAGSGRRVCALPGNGTGGSRAVSAALPGTWRWNSPIRPDPDRSRSSKGCCLAVWRPEGQIPNSLAGVFDPPGLSGDNPGQRPQATLSGNAVNDGHDPPCRRQRSRGGWVAGVNATAREPRKRFETWAAGAQGTPQDGGRG